MMKKIGVVVLVASLSGCGGLEISSLSVEEAEGAHKSGQKISGYIVYHPMIVVAVKKEKVATEDGTIQAIKCVVGKPQTLPDYEKPFLLRLKPGIGKSSVNLKIEDGWRLDGVEAESDTTALLEEIVRRGGVLSTSTLPDEQQAEPETDITCKPDLEPGLYRLSLKNRPATFDPINFD